MRRIREIVAAARRLYPDEDFFANFEEKCRTLPAVLKHYRAYGRALAILETNLGAFSTTKLYNTT
jgi:hypothetical protein